MTKAFLIAEPSRDKKDFLCRLYVLNYGRYQKCICVYYIWSWGFPGGSESKESACNCRRPGFNPWVGKIPLEKGMATHSSILAWLIPWTEQGGGLQSTGCIRVRYNRATNTFTLYEAKHFSFFPYLKCIIQWFLLQPKLYNNFASITTIDFRTLLFPFTHALPPPVLGNHWFIFCL